MNLRKHGVAFHEGATVLRDPLAITIFDPDHSEEEDRYITAAPLALGGFFSSPIPIEAPESVSSARENSPARSVRPMKTKSRGEMAGELRAEYDLGQLLKSGIQGKYADRYWEGTNLVLLEPDVADAFPTEKSVNEALRLVIQFANIQGARKKVSAGA